MARYATRYYPELEPGDMRWVLVEASRPDPARGRRGPGPLHGRASCASAASTCRLNTRLESCVDGHVVLSDGEEFDAETLVWTAGVKANPMLADTDLPLDDKGRLSCTADLQGRGRRRAPGRAGDGAAVPDLTEAAGALCSPQRPARGPAGQGARRQHRRGRCAARAPRDYRHKHVGSVASLGLHKGVAQVYGIKLRGLPGLVHAPDLPREPGADAQPQGPGHRRLDAGAVLQARDRLARLAAAAARGVQRGDPVTGGRVQLAVTVIGHDRPGIIADTTRRWPSSAATSRTRP